MSAAYVPGFQSNIFNIMNREALKIESLDLYPERGEGGWIEYLIPEMVLHKNLVFNSKGALPHLGPNPKFD